MSRAYIGRDCTEVLLAISSPPTLYTPRHTFPSSQPLIFPLFPACRAHRLSSISLYLRSGVSKSSPRGVTPRSRVSGSDRRRDRAAQEKSSPCPEEIQRLCAHRVTGYGSLVTVSSCQGARRRSACALAASVASLGCPLSLVSSRLFRAIILIAGPLPPGTTQNGPAMDSRGAGGLRYQPRLGSVVSTELRRLTVGRNRL